MTSRAVRLRSETLVYPFPVGLTRIGRADKADPPHVEFNGMGIVKVRPCAPVPVRGAGAGCLPLQTGAEGWPSVTPR